MAGYFYREYPRVTRYTGGSCEVVERSNDVSVLPLSLEGSQVETALVDFKSDLCTRLPYFVEGGVSDLPSLNITVSKEEKKQVLFQSPYDNVEGVYSLAEQSQVGTATMTLFRLDARRSREFSDVEILNQEWKDAVLSVCDQIQEVLAPGATKVTANLYKLLLYHEGDFFNIHQDAQLANRMFATLLFFLPVYHLGGEFTINDPNKSGNTVIIGKPHAECPNPVQSSTEDATIVKYGTDCSWIAFYTDTHHSVSKVTKGYRVVLNYSLSFEGTMSPSHQLSSFNPSTSSVITRYFSAHHNSMIAVPLSYDYTLSTLSPEYLKGYDAHLYNAFSEIAAPHLQFIVSFDKTRVIHRWCDGDIDEPDHEQLFQGIFTIEHDMAKQFFDVYKEQERLLQEVDRQHQESGCDDNKERWKKHADIHSKFNDKYFELMKVVKESAEAPHVEWIVKRGYLGNPEPMKSKMDFTYGQHGWLGNMCPREEYYYLSAAMVVAKKKVK